MPSTIDGQRIIVTCPCGEPVRGCSDPACSGFYHPDTEHSCPHADPDSDGYSIWWQICIRHYEPYPAQPSYKLWGCCDNPDCQCCFGSGVVMEELE